MGTSVPTSTNSLPRVFHLSGPANPPMQPAGASRLAQRQSEHERRLAPVADLHVGLKPITQYETEDLFEHNCNGRVGRCVHAWLPCWLCPSQQTHGHLCPRRNRQPAFRHSEAGLRALLHAGEPHCRRSQVMGNPESNHRAGVGAGLGVQFAIGRLWPGTTQHAR